MARSGKTTATHTPEYTGTRAGPISASDSPNTSDGPVVGNAPNTNANQKASPTAT